MKIRGELTIMDGVIWFNDDRGNCRLRICRFPASERLRLRGFNFIDIIFLPKTKEDKPLKTVRVAVLISESP